ncbi:MAG: response regulator [Candidatus Pacearchaeota archaeon]|jgi:CheY-like chemotaxis protein
MKIIIGDDTREFISAYTRLLKSKIQGIEIDEVYESLDLVERVRGTNYDLVISDNDYNDGIESGGIEAIRKIRGFNQTTPIILHSGDLTEEKRKSALEAGATYAFEKGNVSKLMEIIGGFGK